MRRVCLKLRANAVAISSIVTLQAGSVVSLKFSSLLAKDFTVSIQLKFFAANHSSQSSLHRDEI